MKTIAVDMDSVMLHTNEALVVPELNRAGIPCTVEDITEFSYECLSPDAWPIASSVFKRPDLYDGLDALVMARRVLDRWRREFRVIAISVPFRQHASSKWAFLQRAGFQDTDIYLCGDKLGVYWDVLLDDRMDILLAAKAARRGVVCYDRPWNRDASRVHGIPTAYGWSDVDKKVRSVLK